MPIYRVHFGIWGEKGGGLDLMYVQNKSYLTDVQNRGGGSRALLDNVLKKGAFFLMASLNYVISKDFISERPICIL